MSDIEYNVGKLRFEFVCQYLSSLGGEKMLLKRHFKWLKNYKDLDKISREYFKNNNFTDCDYGQYDKMKKYIYFIINYFDILYKRAKRDFRLALKYYYSHQNDMKDGLYKIGEYRQIFSVDETREMFLDYLQDETTFACALKNALTKSNADIRVLLMILYTD